MSKEKTHIPAIGKINIALGILIIAGVAVNVYQLIGNNSLRSELYTLEAEIEALQNESTTLDTELSSGKENIANLSTQLEELETAIGNLEANNKSLSENLEELKATKEVTEETQSVEINSTHTNTELGNAGTTIEDTDIGFSGNESSSFTGNVDSNTGSNDILPGGNDNWSGSDGDAASFFNSLPSVGSAPSGHHAGGEGIHAE